MSRAHSLIATLCCLSTVTGHAQTSLSEAFNQGKDYKSQTPALKAAINPAALAQVPGQDMTTTNELKGLYGTTLKTSGQSKIAACAAYVPGTDAYRNAECDTVNYVSGNPEVRPHYTIDKTNDPMLIRSSNVRNMPEANTAGATGLSGTYTACTDHTSQQPERFDTQRCQIGRPVTEAACSMTLKVSYAWESYAGQTGADLRYARCSASDVRGDRLTIPLTDAYRTETTLCSARDHGDGVEQLFWYRNCAGNETLQGYDASACSHPPNPAIVLAAPKAVASCSDAPRNAENCFTPEGHFTAKAQAPVFTDNWDNSACADLESHGAVISN